PPPPKNQAVMPAPAPRDDPPDFPFWPMLFDNITIRLLGSDDFPTEAKRQAATAPPPPATPHPPPPPAQATTTPRHKRATPPPARRRHPPPHPAEHPKMKIPSPPHHNRPAEPQETFVED